jgi:hypothetical protein
MYQILGVEVLMETCKGFSRELAMFPNYLHQATTVGVRAPAVGLQDIAIFLRTKQVKFQGTKSHIIEIDH